MNTPKRVKTATAGCILFILLTLFTLAACGGSSGGGNDSTTHPPDTTATAWDQIKWDENNWQ